ncbi:MAG: sigma-54-dependent Fis family transcriptional regulator [Acidimicrobiia bacterium]|nr:sigma-54-dependent Fis family transcriptional regulator [Acidimicrobiia bacterium]
MLASTIANHHWIARDRASVEILRTVEKVKNTYSTLLIQGETGTGKDLLASLIHYSSLRRNEPFLRIDCSSIPAELIETELFGHEKGAFTGAYARKPGKLEFAGRGTIILDEIATLGMETQAKLLRVIEERTFGRLGGHEAIPVEARLIVLSRERLENLVRAGTFREDLFFRLNVIPIHLLPLRERADDILPLTKHFLQSFCERYEKGHLRVDRRVFSNLARYSFPGNVRELRNLVEGLVMLAEGEAIEPHHLPDAVRRKNSSQESRERPTLEQLERQYVTEILDFTRGRIGKAAAILGISRKTLLEKRKRYGLVD